MTASAWRARRFWSRVEVGADEGGHRIHLDARPLRTPAKAELKLPTAALAEGVAEEWRAVEGEIRPDEMPLTRAANSAIDRVAPEFRAVADIVAGYGETDLLCYRAEAPQALVARQTAGWDPWLRWAAEALGAPLISVAGVLPAEQPARSVAALRARVDALSPFGLTGLHDLVVHSGSLVLGLAVLEGALAPDAAWRLSRIDEDWQAEQWGLDAEAEAAAEARRRAFEDAVRLLDLLERP